MITTGQCYHSCQTAPLVRGALLAPLYAPLSIVAPLVRGQCPSQPPKSPSEEEKTQNFRARFARPNIIVSLLPGSSISNQIIVYKEKN